MSSIEPTLPPPATLAIAMLDHMPSHAALLDRHGVIVHTNRAWRSFAAANGGTEQGTGVGSNYLAVCDAAWGDCGDEAQRIGAGLREVLARRQDHFEIDYACDSPTQRQWFRMEAVALTVAGWEGVLVTHRDFTRTVRERAHLAADRDAYRLLFDANPNPMWVYDRQTLRFLAVNDTALAKYGYTREAFLGLTLLDIRPQEQHAALLQQTSEPLQSIVHGGLWHHQARDGRRFLVQITSHALEWEGRPARLVLANDVGERVAAEQALRESEHRFRQMAENLTEVFWLSDTVTGELLYVSPAYERVWGRSVTSLLEQPQEWLDSVVDSDRQRVATAFAHQDDGSYDVEFSIRRPDGELRRIAARSLPVVDADGVVRRAAGTARDITAKHEQGARLRLLELAVARLNDIVLITEAEPFDEPGPRIVFVNDAFERRTGYTRDEVIGRTPRILQGKDTQRAELDRIRAALKAWQPVRAELINYTKAGVPFWLELDIVPLADDGGWYTHWVAVERDITERKTLEHQMQQSQRLESLGQLTGGVAHDFNNLLTVILGNAEVLAEKLVAGTREQRLADMISSAAQRGADLTQRLLAFARKQPLAPRTIDLNRLLTDMDALLRRSLGEHVEIELVRAAGLWRTLVDPGQFENALLNLGINARDAMPQGGRLTLETANAHLDAAYVRPHVGLQAGQYVMLAVSDTGGGIPAEHLGRVFEPFFTTKEKGKGTGLGLAMVYGFVKQSGGHLSIYSEVDRGTTVRIYLPRELSDQQAAASNQGPEHVAVGAGQLILLVEDDAMVREFARSSLLDLGYRVIEAANGPEALGLIDQHPDIDLLFTDIVMPGGMSGRVLADAALVRRPGLAVLYTSGYTENAIVHHGRLDPGVRLLGKPYRRVDLARKVHEALHPLQGNGA